jgi:hypothetical protein
MAIEPPKIDPPAQKAAAPHGQNRAVAGEWRAVRTADLCEEEIAAVEASEIAPGFEHLDAELGQPGMSVVDVGVDFCRRLRARGNAAKGRAVDKGTRNWLPGKGRGLARGAHSRRSRARQR